MSLVRLRAVVALAAVLFAVSVRTDESRAAAATERPNILFIVIDNVGYGDLGCYGNKTNRTPAMDRLAADGVRLTQFYCGCPSCTPSRGTLLTGRHSERTGLNWQLLPEQQLGVGLPLDERIIPADLKPLGYGTGAFGKWNIGFGPGGRPTERGFDAFFGHASGNIDYYHHLYNQRLDTYRGTENVRVEGYSTDLFADAAIEFMKSHAKEPWFVYLPFNAAHVPNKRNTPPGENTEWQVPAKYLEAYGWSADDPDNNHRYAAVLTALDDAIGRVLAEVDRQGAHENTFVFLMSDNGAHNDEKGPEGNNGGLRGGITTCYEGGIRVPAAARWPGRIPPGSVCKQITWAMDLLPTFVVAAGGSTPTDRVLDGVDIGPALAGGKAPSRDLYWKFRGTAAVRTRDWKLVRAKENGPWELYDLANDVGEKNDLSAQHPKLAEDLAARFDAWLASTTRKKTDAAAALPKTLLTERGKLLASEDLSSPVESVKVGSLSDLTKGWRLKPGKWEFVEGAMRGTQLKGDNHSAGASLAAPFTDAIIQVEMQLNGCKQAILRVNDRNEHICRVIVNPRGFSAQKDDHDHEGPDQAVPFGTVAWPIAHGEWKTVLLEIRGDEMVATVDGHSIAGTHPLLAAEKANIGLIVTGTSANFRNLRIWEAKPNRDWPATKAKLIKP
jgi:arylsulfatase A-like enzyme